MLYPIHFKPIIFERIWGGKKLRTLLGKEIGKIENAGESWEISAVEGAESIVENGILAGNTYQNHGSVYV
jgi:mannose-6-phosphate isomerase